MDWLSNVLLLLRGRREFTSFADNMYLLSMAEGQLLHGDKRNIRDKQQPIIKQIWWQYNSRNKGVVLAALKWSISLEKNNHIFTPKHISSVCILSSINNTVDLWTEKEHQIQEPRRDTRQLHQDPRRRLDLLQLTREKEEEREQVQR